MDVRKRIIQALDESKKTRQELADKLGVGRAAVSDMLNKEGDLDSLKYLEATAELTGVSFDWLRTGKEPKSNKEYALRKSDPDEFKLTEKTESYLSGQTIRPLTVTVDKSGRELITYVPVKAQAGYRRGYGDAGFIEKLPAFSLPLIIEKDATHRMFQVDGNSMRQLGGGGLNDGDVVIAKYVEDIFSVKDNRVYVVVTTEGIIVKRCINRLNTADKIIVAKSDSEKKDEYPAIILHAHEILEVWELKAFISKQLSFSTDLYDTINDMQVQMALIQDKLKLIDINKIK